MKNKPKDKLEQFIRGHRSEFDSADPPDEIWKAVSWQLDHSNPENVPNHWLWVWKAAAILFFGLSAYLFIQINGNKRSEYNMNITWEQQIAEFENAEQYYNSIIHVKKQELINYLDEKSPFYYDFKKDISELDSMYILLKGDFDTNSNDLVMDAMIRNLQLRIEIMDRQLQIIQKVKQVKNKNNDDVTI